MRLPSALAHQIIEHARAEFPNECCGLIAGSGDLATRVLPTTNAEGLVAIYHTHTRSAAYPSKTDVELAFFAEPLYVIVSLQDSDQPVIRAFRLARSAPEGEQITEEPITAPDA